MRDWATAALEAGKTDEKFSRYSSGMSLDVFLCPNQPDLSVLKPGYSLDLLVVTLDSIVLMVFGVVPFILRAWK
jgi:capsule polysaccharide export protein KpsE/RkpR